VSATGGAETTYTGYKVHTFLADGTFTVNGTLTNIDVLVVGQGGPSGASIGGGGGGGGVVSGTGLTLPTNTYSIIVGNSTTADYGENGEDSTALGQTAKGGGRGGDWSPSINGEDGGSGGGGAATPLNYSPQRGDAIQSNFGFQSTYGGSGTVYGNNGAAGAPGSPYPPGGGGGGAGAIGTNPHGGDGIQISWVTPQALGYSGTHNGVANTTAFYWAGGGGSGSQSSTAGNGGKGGGSSGLFVYNTGRGTEGSGGLNTSATSGDAGSKGATNTGGGAGAAQHIAGDDADTVGGSGIVVIRYAV
jgi:hypothetical protein